MVDIIPNWHPLLVHFTISFVVLTGALQLLAWFRPALDRNAAFEVTLKWLVVLSALAVIATVLAGLSAYNSVAHDTPSHLAMTDHRNWGLVTAITFLLGATLFFILPASRRFLAGSCFIGALLLVSVTGYKGGELVYRYGLGVMSLPQVESSDGGHSHSHAVGTHNHAEDEPDAEPHDH